MNRDFIYRERYLLDAIYEKDEEIRKLKLKLNQKAFERAMTVKELKKLRGNNLTSSK